MLHGDQTNRRDDERLQVRPMYSAVTASRSMAGEPARLEGHIYDISEGGVRIELDEVFEPGEQIDVRLALPGVAAEVKAEAAVVWVSDPQDDPGPRRMALRFVAFADHGDHERLIDYLIAGGVRRAA